jgi:hypothetical protein
VETQAAARAAPVKTTPGPESQGRRPFVRASQFAGGILQRKCACGGIPGPSGECEQCRKQHSGLLQRQASGTRASAGVPAVVHEVLNSPGQPLDAATRGFMEPRFGYDFGQVQVHSDARAGESARAVNALAYTVGSHLVFDIGQYAPTTTAGQRLLAHELTHTIQQGKNPSTASLRISNKQDLAEREAEQAAAHVTLGLPFRPWVTSGWQIARQEASPGEIDWTNPYETPPGARQAEEFAVMTLSVVKDPILEALRHYDSISFLNRLRAVDAEDRRRLEADRPFMAEIRRYFRGLPLWTVRLILHFGQNRPENVRRLYLAVFERNYRLVKDLIRTESELRSEAQTPGAREMLNYELRGTPDHDEVLRLMDQQETTGRFGLVSSYGEAHYETKSGFWNELVGSSELRRFTGETAYTLARTANELRVIVRIHLVSNTTTNETYYPTDAKMNEWRSGIEAAWNKPFYAWNGTTQLTIVFIPIFTAQNPHHTVLVQPGNERSDETHWYEEDSGTTIAHEFGHMLGNPDEYRLPGRISEIPASLGLTPEQARRSSVEGITGRPGSSDTTFTGIMGAVSGTAEKRHIQPILDFYNRNGKPSNESDYRVL